MIGLIVPLNNLGGVRTITCNLYRGLLLDGFDVELLIIGKNKHRVVSIICHDISNYEILKKFDIIMYLGNIPWPSHVIAKLSGKCTVCFINGLVNRELLYRIFYGKGLRNKIGAIVEMTFLNISKLCRSVDLYVYHSYTAYEEVKILRPFCILPQFVFPDEIEELCNKAKNYEKQKLRIVTYTSFAQSPRLLSLNDLIMLAQLLKHYTKQDFEFIIVSPKCNEYISNNWLKIIPPLPYKDFLSLLSSSDIFIERCIDEELSLSSLEAASLGVPVAKITHYRYWDRQDYKNEFILAKTIKELIKKVSEIIENKDSYILYYSKLSEDYVIKRRTWNAVKKPFLKALKEMYYR